MPRAYARGQETFGVTCQSFPFSPGLTPRVRKPSGYSPVLSLSPGLRPGSGNLRVTRQSFPFSPGLTPGVRKPSGYSPVLSLLPRAAARGPLGLVTSDFRWDPVGVPLVLSSDVARDPREL